VNTYTVTYSPGANGIGTQQSTKKTHDVVLTLNEAMFTRNGYTQTGWSTSDGGVKVYNLGATYAPNTAVTLFPYWTLNTYTVTYNPGANGGVEQQTVVKAHDVNITLKDAMFTRDGGYTQTCWSTSDGGAKAYGLGASYTNNAPLILYPYWERQTSVQLWEDGPYWATTNVGADEPWEYGYYFWWGDTVGYKRERYAWVASDGSSSNFCFDNNVRTYGVGIYSNIDGGRSDAAHIQWGGNWRMPTNQEMRDLNDKCDWTWTMMNGINGYVVRGRGDYASNSIFLSCAGYGKGTSFLAAGNDGGYWSSSPYPTESYRDYSWYLHVNSYGHNRGYAYRYYGYSIRPVRNSAK
jgi:hypothetical protein